MKRARSTFILALFIIPIVVLFALGVFALWEKGWLFWAWFIIPLCWGPAYLLARRQAWSAGLREAPRVHLPAYWTHQDDEAWKIVEKAVSTATGIAPQSLLDPSHYLRAAEQLIMEVTRFYHPKAEDPLGPVTLPELLTAAQLAMEDLAELVNVYVPGSHHLSIARWRMMSKFPRWYGIASNLSYMASAIFGPAATATRYAIARLVLGPALRVMQDNLMYWFYGAFLQRVGLYAIELNSGRLKVGARRWRQLIESTERTSNTSVPAAQSPAHEPESLTITIVGQVKAGKSSLANAILGRTEAAYDDLPTTQVVSRYELIDEEWLGKLTIQDTPGYGSVDDAPTMAMAVEASAHSDIVLLAANVIDAAREVDRVFWRRFDEWFTSRHHLRRPAVVVVATHIDLLSPSMEWAPPYEAWRGAEPKSPKDEAIRSATTNLAQQVFTDAVEVIPVCTGPTSNDVYGVEEWLVPALLARLGEARAVLLLRAIHRETKKDTWKRVWEQTRDAGTMLLRKSVGA